MKTKRIIVIILIVFFLVGCGTPTSNAYITPQQISEPQIADITPTFEIQVERVNNCDGTNPTYNVSYKTIESQKATFEVSVGAGGLVKGTPVPPVLEVQLEAKITAALAKDYSLTTEKDHDITLDNPKGTYLEHTIEWKVTRVKGLIEVVYGDGVAQVVFDKIANVELYNRTSVPLGCNGDNVALPTSTSASEIPTATSSLQQEPTIVATVENFSSTQSHQLISLRDIGSYTGQNLGIAAGIQNFNGIEFETGWIATTQSQGGVDESKPSSYKILVRNPEINETEVYFLWQASWAMGRTNDEIGSINIHISNGEILQEKISVGYNIRDWSDVTGNLSSPYAQEAHSSGDGVVDMFFIPIPSEYNGYEITQIDIEDTSEVMGIHLWAITIR